MIFSTENGCTCAAVRALSSSDGAPKADDWKCIACRGRGAATEHCKHCGIGLFDGPETDRKVCTECYYARYGD